MGADGAVSRWITEPSAASGVASRIVARRRPEVWDAPSVDGLDLVRALGAGGMGTVYEAIDRERGTRAALKLLQPDKPSLRIRFKGEFRTLSAIAHANVVRADALVEEGEALYFTMELVEGVHFLDHVRPGGARAAEARLWGAFAQLARGIAAIHWAGRVHRDVKPANVLVTTEGRVVVLDLGLALDVGRGEREARRVGTSSFMAPEQAAARSVGTAADWYSFGVMLHAALVGALPCSLGSPPVLRLGAHRTGLLRDLASLCTRLLSHDPVARPTGAEILRALGAGEEVRARAPSPSFTGRERELDVLDSAFAEVLGGRPSAITVAGPEGAGKSALLSRFLDLVKEDAIVLSGRCDPRERLRYQAIDGILDGLGRHLARLPREELREVTPPDAALLALAFPVLRTVWLPLSSDACPPSAIRARAVTALRALLRRLSAVRPLVLAVDDLHLADPESIALLADVLRPPDAPALLFVAATRTGAEPRACAHIPLPTRRLPLG